MSTPASELAPVPDYDFIDLGRSFHELSKYSGENDDVDISQAFRVGDRLTWSNLLAEFRLIVLSEAGSGKTAEIRNAARVLRTEGKAAFFLRLEHIPSNFEDAFEVGSFEEFEEWLSSGQEGWLLLDSVDEARLRNPGDFELAIRKLGRRISTAKDRTHIVITGRTTAWRPKTDLDNCKAHLPYTPPAATAQVQKPDEDVELEDTVVSVEQDKAPPMFRVVALDDLNAEQISTFATARGIGDTKGFIEAIERADGWSFTARPQDLAELTEFWIDQGRIGSRLEIMRHSIDRRLAERDQNRADARPLAADRAHHGARLLAAAATLTQSQIIRVPDGADNETGLDVRSVLSDWDDKDRATLLSMPIFDEAIYGTVRFHHRSVREYLTAQWFADLLARDTSRRNIEGLFFREQYGMEIVVPTLRPILPWLVILDEKIRERVRKVAPEIIFEGGDPSQLPLDVRRFILHEVCEQMAGGTAGRTMRDYSAVQRFANPDLTEDIRSLIRKYGENDDLTSFLLRMVWLGELKGLRAEALEIALKPDADEYLRITAFRAVRAVGAAEDWSLVRQHFLTEGPTLDRHWLAELMEGLEPTADTADWLVACLEKSEQKQRYSVDHLIDRVEAFIGGADIGLLPRIVTQLNRLLSLSPLIERRHCEVSKKFQWLIAPAAKVVERLVAARHPAALADEALGVLDKLSAVQGYGLDDTREIKAEFSKLVPAWPELNQALFWFEVRRSRAALDKKSERLIDFWQASIFGSFTKFGPLDFNYVAQEIVNRSLLDDKLVALSLAFSLYRQMGRPSAVRDRLKRLAAIDPALAAQLAIYLKPPSGGQDRRRWKKMQESWKRRDEANKKKQADYDAGWKEYLTTKLDESREAQARTPGKPTNALYYLFDRGRNDGFRSGRWTEYNWRKLIPEHGEDAARFYRDSAVQLWRNNKPKLRSEGAPLNETPYTTIIGLSGLEIESIEANNSWPLGLTADEIEHACRYASFELNGFPTWFPKLMEAYPAAVTEFLMREIRYELSIEKPDKTTHYIISDVSWSGAWAWDALAPHILDDLKKSEPTNLDNLDKLLAVVQGSSISDDQLRTLATKKCRTIKRLDHLARWFAVWVGVDPGPAIEALRSKLDKISDQKKRVEFAMTFVTLLWGSRRGDRSSVRQAFQVPEHLKAIYLLTHEHIRMKDDINRAGTGVYSPGLRDNAQDSRNSLFDLLNKIPGKESFLALVDIASAHPEETLRPWMLHHAKVKAEQDGDIEPWPVEQVREFGDKLERTPANHRELADLAHMRFLDLRDDLENGDSSIASILLKADQETEMRKYLGHVLREKAHGRYSIPQEEELADAKRPDLRFLGALFDGPVPAELKLADKWTGPALVERLENQLCGDYLRDNRSSRGLFILVYRGEKAGWDVPGAENRVDFEGLLKALQNHWLAISAKFPNVDAVEVVGIDLTKRAT